MKNLTQGNIYKRFLSFGLPLMLGGLIAQLYNIVDTAMVGKLLGEKELGAVSATSSLFKVVMCVFWGFSGGIGAYLAKLYGRQDIKGIKKTIKFVLLLYFIVSTILTVGLIVFKGPIFSLLKVDEVIVDLAIQYYMCYACGIYSFALTNVLYHMFTSTNRSVMPFVANLISCVLNIVGNYLAIAVFNLGVFGVALSSVIASLIVVIYYLIALKGHLIKLNTEKGSGNLNKKEIFGYGLPCLFQQWVIYLPGFIISPFINNLGYEATSSLAVINILFTLCEQIYVNSSRAVGIHSAQCLGENNYARIKKGVRAGLVQEMVFVVPVVLFCIIFPNFVCDIFLDETATPIIREHIIRYIYFCSPFILINATCSMLHSFYRGVKSLKILIFVTALAGTIRTLVTLLCISAMQMSAVYLGWILSWAIEALVSWILYFSNKWQPKEMKKVVEIPTNEVAKAV